MSDGIGNFYEICHVCGQYILRVLLGYIFLFTIMGIQCYSWGYT